LKKRKPCYAAVVDAQKSPGVRGFQDGSGGSWKLLETYFLAEQAGFEPAEGY
jgi:hypothetical protein